MLILGIGGWEHDANCALIEDGVIMAIGEEERFSRRRYDGQPHWKSLEFCLGYGKGHMLDAVTYYMARDHVEDFHATYTSFLSKTGIAQPVLMNHHLTHAASAFYPSGFPQAAVLCVDGFGDGISASAWLGRNNALELLWEVPHPHSLGLLWKAVTKYLGFGSRDEGKIMALASYGEPKYRDVLLDNIILHNDGSYEFDLRRNDISKFLGRDRGFFAPIAGPQRVASEPLRQQHFDIASSLQEATNIIARHMAHGIRRLTDANNLCLAGGVALNSVMNGHLRDAEIFQSTFVPPFPGDNGTGYGGALHLYHRSIDRSESTDFLTPYLGADLDSSQLAYALEAAGSRPTTRIPTKGLNCESTSSSTTLIPPQDVRLSHFHSENTIEDVAKLLTEGWVIGWYQGRAEVGPRALGNRSILADPRRQEMRDHINFQVKHREWFRPLAPVVTQEDQDIYFESCHANPYMAFVTKVREPMQKIIPAVSHVDGTARVQTVSQTSNLLFYQLLRAFERHSGVPVLLNTSLNDQEPIVNTPDHALGCLRRTQMDALCIGDTLIFKT